MKIFIKLSVDKRSDTKKWIKRLVLFLVVILGVYFLLQFFHYKLSSRLFFFIRKGKLNTLIIFQAKKDDEIYDFEDEKICIRYAVLCRVTKDWCQGRKIDKAKLVRVIDGDTISVKIGDTIYKVRYIGINAPELHPLECYGKQAKEFNKTLFDGIEFVYLIRDVRYSDRYGRLLRYVFTKKDFINLRLVQEGYARAFTVPPDVTFSQCFLKYQHIAMDKHVGLWDKECDH